MDFTCAIFNINKKTVMNNKLADYVLSENSKYNLKTC